MLPRWTRRYQGHGSSLEVTLDGRRVTQRRCNERAEVEVHDTLEEARDIAERIAANAVAHGGVLVHETTPALDATVETASNPELAARCRAAPEDPAPWEAYADWLRSRGDVRGELAALVRANDPSAVERMLALRLALFGGHVELVDSVELSHHRFGFPTTADVKFRSGDYRWKERIEALLALPLVELLDTLHIGDAYEMKVEINWFAVLDTITSSHHATTLRELRFEGGYTDLTAVVNLTALETFGVGALPRPIAHPTLRRLFVVMSHGDEIGMAATSMLPKLVHLEINCAGSQPDLAQVQALIDADLPALRHLGLVRQITDEQLVSALGRSRLLPQLRTLALGPLPLTPTAARCLADDAARFRHLERVEVGPHRNERLARELPSLRIVEA